MDVFLYFYSFIRCGGETMSQSTHSGLRTSCVSLFSPFALWMKLRVSALAGACLCLATLLTLSYVFICMRFEPYLSFYVALLLYKCIHTIHEKRLLSLTSYEKCYIQFHFNRHYQTYLCESGTNLHPHQEGLRTSFHAPATELVTGTTSLLYKLRT